jgi:acyl-CoA ligase (AMP-forming) (exosortase A-associated)
VDAVRTWSYAALVRAVDAFAAQLWLRAGVRRGDRVAVWLDHRAEHVVASFGTARAGAAFVAVHASLKPAQVLHILHDATPLVLVTTVTRLARLHEAGAAADLPPLVVCIDDDADWPGWLQSGLAAPGPQLDSDIAAILYTSGSTGRPKGVVLSHRNLVAGAASVAGYLGNGPQDTLLAVLPLSFDAGFSQLTTAFHVGARVVLMNYLLPRDVLRAIDEHQVTGLTAVPPLYLQLAQAAWPAGTGRSLRYFASTGGRMPRATLDSLRLRWPQARPFLMYGLTEAFRSTYLSPDEVDRRPDSIGRAIPHAEVLVLRDDGSECAIDEPGELVHRGPLVAQGYWNDAQRTAERFRPLPPGLAARPAGLVLPEIAVFSGDTVCRDAEGFLYFIGRRDEMIKTSGYRVSPTEVEEVLYATQRVGECVAFGVDHLALGQSVQVIATAPAGVVTLDIEALLADCRQRMPAYMVPAGVEAAAGPLPRNPNGKIDRKLLATGWLERHG